MEQSMIIQGRRDGGLAVNKCDIVGLLAEIALILGHQGARSAKFEEGATKWRNAMEPLGMDEWTCSKDQHGRTRPGEGRE
jgi:hypothetical protein